MTKTSLLSSQSKHPCSKRQVERRQLGRNKVQGLVTPREAAAGRTRGKPTSTTGSVPACEPQRGVAPAPWAALNNSQVEEPSALGFDIRAVVSAVCPIITNSQGLAACLLQLLLDCARYFSGIGSDGWFESLHHVAVSINQEFGEVPFDVSANA